MLNSKTCLILLRLMFLLLLVGSAVPLASASGVISGSVVSSSGSAPIANVTVNAYNSSWDLVASSSTDASGVYAIPNLPAGTYYIRSYNNQGYIDRYYSTSPSTLNIGRGSASSIALGEGEYRDMINLSLLSGSGSISGRVVRDSDQEGISNITVVAYYSSDSTSYYVAWVKTDASGYYSIPGLTPSTLLGNSGNYYVRTTNKLGYINRFTDNTEHHVDSTPFAIVGGVVVSNKNFTLTFGGSISGRVTRESDGTGIAGAQIQAYKQISFTNELNTTTDADGNYTINCLPAGYYWVSVTTTQGYITGFYPDSTLYNPMAVPVSLGTETPGIDFSLAMGGSISGRVTRDADGTGISGLTVYAYDTDWYWRGSGSTNASGDYSIKGLRSGSYYIAPQAPISTSSPPDYIVEYYKDSALRQTATAVAVSQPSDTGNINLSLAPHPVESKGSVSGHLARASNGSPVASAFIMIYTTTGQTVAYIISDSSGNYTVSLFPGSYYVRVNGTSSYAGEYYSQAAAQKAATVVSVLPGGNTPNIDFALSSPGTISGTIWGWDWIYGVTVYVYDTNWNQVATGSTNGFGNYSISALLPGSYYIAARTPGYVDQYFSEYYYGATEKSEASMVYIAAGTNTPVDFYLWEGGAIQGTVTRSSDGLGIEGIQVNIYDSDWDFVASTHTDSSGAYKVEGFYPGSYYLRTVNSTGYIDEYFHNAATAGNAAAVHVYGDPLLTEWNYNFSLVQPAPIPQAERDALLALFSSTNGSLWARNSGWEGGPGTECSWHGIECMPDENAEMFHVKTIDLSGNNLSGFIPAELGNLTKLRYLYLYSNQLAGPIPPELGNLTDLLDLDLFSNQLTGPIPPELGNLTSLRYLYLFSNQLTGPIPPALGNLTDLFSLDLSENLLTGLIPPELGNPTNLRYLYLDSNQLTGPIPPEMGNLTNLIHLILYSNQLTGSIPPALGNLTDLEILFLNNNRLTGEVPFEITYLPLMDSGGLTLQYNCRLRASNPTVEGFINAKVGSDWANTQNACALIYCDIDGNGNPDIIWRNAATGDNYVWYLDGVMVLGGGSLPTVADQSWQLVGVEDFNGDEKPDILWRNVSTGDNYVWYLDGVMVQGGGSLPTVADQNWRIVGTGDFNNDGKPDVLWRSTATGANYVWYLDGVMVQGGGSLPEVADQNWKLVGVADFNNDGKPDVLWRSAATGENYVWYLDGVTVQGGGSLPEVADQNWKLVGVADFNNDGKPDVLWRSAATGDNYIWYLDGVTVQGGGSLPTVADQSWTIVP